MTTKATTPRIGQCYGMAVTPTFSQSRATWIEGEMMCSDYGQFRRRGLVRHDATGEPVRVRCDIPDTYFSIPATTATQHGYVTCRDDGEFAFVPHTEQTETPAQFRKTTRQAYR